MKKSEFFKINSLLLGFLMLGAMLFISCDDDDDDPDPVSEPTATFGEEIDGLTVKFDNASVGAESYNWEFGDGQSSTDEDPTHTYATGGTYTVKLTVTNSAGSDETTKELTVQEPVYNDFIAGKTWQLVRGEALAYNLGPQSDDWSYSVHNWFSYGDGAGAQVGLNVRKSAANDLYTFNTDGTYDVDFQGDFWGESNVFPGEFNETHIDISSGALPENSDGENVDAFIAGTWEYVINENTATLEVVGAGAHIINPRYKNGSSSYGVGTGITYNIFKIVANEVADTLVLYSETTDNDFGTEPRQYIILAHYYGEAPDIVEGPPEFIPVDLGPEISASTISHSFLAEGDFGAGVDEATSSSVVEYGVTQDGETCTKVTRTDADGGFTDFKLRSVDSDIRFDTDGTYDFSKATLMVYVPSTNDFSGSLANQVTVKVADWSFFGPDENGQGPGFWTSWVTVDQTDIALDQWVTLEFDFTDLLNDENAQDGIRDGMDVVIIEFGGAGHLETGEVYYKDFKFVE